MAPGNVSLLSDFDRDTALLFPQTRLRAAAPTRSELQRVGAEIAQKVRAEASAGHETQVYFIFAGHGDVDQGLGFIELADARFTSRDLEAWLRQIPFTRAHVILDSCNSFFMLGVRKPGGRHFATPEDDAKALAARMPNVGVFLSTSAEGEAFEWSELQSGIFSHVVRSGLLGAADANGDGSVSYLELAGFVETATADVRNSNMRPHIFARGPFARDDAPIVDLRGHTDARRFRLSDAAPLRIRLRDREGLPILDTNTEAGRRLELVLPESWAKGAIVERSNRHKQQPDQLGVYAVPELPGVVELASLEPVTARGESRGPDEVFQNLFARPYGPVALAAYVAERKSRPPEVYGVSREDTLRMELVLSEIEHAERSERLQQGAVQIGLGALIAVAGASEYYFNDRLTGESRKGAHLSGAIDIGLGALVALGGGYTLTFPRRAGEKAAADFRAAVSSGVDVTQAFALADVRLQQMVARERRGRWVQGILGGVLAIVSGSAIIGYELSHSTPDDRYDWRIVGGAGVVLGGALLTSALLIESPAERLTKIWRDDPSLVQLHPTVSASNKGAMFGLGGTF
jgi:flagellar motor protein MotB